MVIGGGNLDTIDGKTYFKYRFKGVGSNIDKNEKRFFIIFILIILFKFIYIGYSYIPFLDDYVQYGLYPKLDDIKNTVFFGGAKTIYTRPFATLTDVYLIGRAGLKNLGIVLFIITFLHALSAVFFFKAFKKIEIYLSPVFLVIYALSPITTEGTFWISASSRIIIPIFFVSLELYIAARANCKYGIYSLISVWMCNILSYGYYEQVAFLSFALTIYFSIKIKDKKLLIIGVSNFIMLCVYYLLFAGLGDNADRVSIVEMQNILPSFKNVIAEILNLWCVQGMKLGLIGLKRGLEVVITDSSFLWILAMSALILCAFSSMNRLRYSNEDEENSRKISRALRNKEIEKIILGAALFAIPYIPFFITGNTWMNFRNTTPSILGLAIVLDAIIKKAVKSDEFVNFISAVLIMVFLITTVSEIKDYINSAGSDLALIQNVSWSVKEDSDFIDVYVPKREYIEQNAPFRDHIISLTSTDYGITGAVRALSGNFRVIVR